ncbi:DUF2510 domain-containing protein [Mycobacterium adipatum]|uniref:DUF2510 domain-containing protein n=1 Tax=Mycobacterium adipatum TaxID=1682113 RepID=UPI0034E07254
MTHHAPEGWYPDPTGTAQQRFWDGEQWTQAIAAPTVITVAVPAPPAKDWAQRHPAWTTLIVFWIACMIWQWEWLVPVIAIVAAIVWTARWIDRRNARLAAEADRQNRLYVEGDARGMYGDYPPAAPDQPERPTH